MTAGIYRIRNISNSKLYIGSSNNIERRFRQHKNSLKAGTHPNSHLQRAFEKYGKENFKFKIIEDLTEFENREDFYDILLDVEDYYINTHKTINSGYNIVEANRTQLSEMVRDRLGKKVSRAKNITGVMYLSSYWDKNSRVWQYQNPKKDIYIKRNDLGKLYQAVSKIDEWRIIKTNNAKSVYREDYNAKIKRWSLGAANISRQKHKTCAKGYIYEYDKTTNGQRIHITRARLRDLVKEVHKRGLLAITNHVLLIQEIRRDEEI